MSAPQKQNGHDKETVIRIRGLVNGFGNKLVHDHIDLDVYRGEVLGVVGGSGSGKSVLLRSIIGLNPPREGTVEVFGKPTSEEIEGPAMRELEMRWGVLFQEGALFSSQTVTENIQVPMREYTGMSQELMDEIAEVKLAMVGLPCETGDKFPSELSGGMKKRAGLARALALDPELLFLDEPTAGLDPLRSDEFVDLVRSLHRQLGFTVVMVTHDLDTLLALATRVAVLADKRVIVCDTVPEVLKVDHPFIHTFFLGERGLRALGDLAPKGMHHGKP